MKTLGNILWYFPFFGFVSAAAVYLVGLLLTMTVIAAPIGLGLMEFGKFLFAPFGRTMVSKSDLNLDQNKAWKTYSTIVMVMYFPFGILLAVFAAIQVALLCFTIIGIPVALVIAKSLGTYLNPINKKCVSSAVGDELERRKGHEEVERHLGPSRIDNANRTDDAGARKDSNIHLHVQQSAPTDTATGSPKTLERVLIFCTECGSKNELGSSFCADCGTELVQA